MTQRGFNNKLMSIAQSKYPLPKPVESKWMRFYIPTLQPLLFEMGYDLPFSNDVFTWGYSAAQWGIILKTPEYYKLLQAAYLDITTSQIQAIESLYNAPQPVDMPEQSNVPQPSADGASEQTDNAPQLSVDKFAKQIYTAYWHEVKSGNIKASTEKREMPEWAKLDDVKIIFQDLCQEDYCKEKGGLYEWNKSASAWVYFIARLADVIQETGLKDSGGRYKWEKAILAFTNPPKSITITGSAQKLKEPDGKGNNVFREPHTKEEIFIESIIKEYS